MGGGSSAPVVPPAPIVPPAPVVPPAKTIESCRRESEEPAPKPGHSKDDITGEDNDLWKVKMSCGHAAAPDSVKCWCQCLLEECHWKFHCPTDVNGKKCGAEWPYQKVRQNASLTKTEQQNYEQKLGMLAAKFYHDFKECPNCQSFVERRDLKNLRVVCILCHSLKGETFEFCWQCLKPWKGSGAPSERCDNEGCKNHSLEVLANCKVKDLPGSEIKNCPSIRACPTCGRLIEHMEKCKYVLCPQCHVKFCFACLETARNCESSKSGAWFKFCAKPLAPRQTQVPVWSEK